MPIYVNRNINKLYKYVFFEIPIHKLLLCIENLPSLIYRTSNLKLLKNIYFFLENLPQQTIVPT